MQEMTDLELEGILWNALRSPHGVLLRTTDLDRLKQKLYRIRRANEALRALHFETSPTDPKGELYITKRDQHGNNETHDEAPRG